MSQIDSLFLFLFTGPKTSLEIASHVNTTCASTIVSDLRQKGCDIRRRLIGYTENGRPINQYSMLSWPKSMAVLAM